MPGIVGSLWITAVSSKSRFWYGKDGFLAQYFGARFSEIEIPSISTFSRGIHNFQAFRNT